MVRKLLPLYNLLLPTLAIGMVCLNEHEGRQISIPVYYVVALQLQISGSYD